MARSVIRNVIPKFHKIETKLLFRAKILNTHCYRPQTKLRKGNVFTPVCHSVHTGGGVHSPGQTSPEQTPPWADIPPRRPLQRTVRIPLECIVVQTSNHHLDVNGIFSVEAENNFFTMNVLWLNHTHIESGGFEWHSVEVLTPTEINSVPFRFIVIMLAQLSVSE